ncbi:MAG: HEAT repeat domain-containing protein [Candidatus Helarchaeota archaeon]
MENKLGKFEKYFEKEDLDKIIKGVDNIFQNKKASNEDYQLAFDVLDKYLEMIKEKSWILSKDVIWTLRKAFFGDLPWHVRQKLILKLGDIVEKFPNELINQIELVDIIINIMKERIEEDPDPDNKFNSVRVLGKIGLEFPDKVILELNKYMKHYEKNIRINAIIALKEIALKYDKTHVKQVLPFLTELFQKDAEHQNILKIVGDAIKEITEKMNEDEVFGDFMVTKQVLCPNCNNFFPEDMGVCSHCGKPIPKCVICGKILDLNNARELYQCPHCGLWFHLKPCLSEWREKNENCPNCFSKIVL